MREPLRVLAEAIVDVGCWSSLDADSPGPRSAGPAASAARVGSPDVTKDGGLCQPIPEAATLLLLGLGAAAALGLKRARARAA